MTAATDNSAATASAAASAGSTTAVASQPRNQRQPRRSFTFAWMNCLRFRLSRARLLDVLCDGLNYCMEGLVYLIGPLLILLALSIVTLLAYSFFFILVPMMQLKYAGSPYANLVIGLHSIWVVFLLVNILFNYALCVTTRQQGPHYDKVVREMAAAANLVYPETPQQLADYRRDFEDKLVLRLRQRKAQQAKDYQEQQQQQQETPLGGMTQRRKGAAASGAATSSTARTKKPKPAPVRHWMLMGPFEWGFCANSNQPKPPRSHYDHVSKQLVLNLDHYCPWMFNAIGYFNYRYFVNFLIYIFVGMMYGALLSYEPFMLLSSDDYMTQSRMERRMFSKTGTRPQRMQPMMPYRDEKTFVALSFMLCAAVGLAVMLLGGFHVYLTLTSQTTIEFHGNWANRKRAKQQGQKWTNPYAVGGWRQNWCQVYGHEHAWWRALLPSTREPDMLPAPMVLRKQAHTVGGAGEVVSLTAAATVDPVETA